MTISNFFNGKIRKYSGKNHFTILYSKYLKAILLYDELEKTQLETYDVKKKDINKIALEKMKEIRGDIT